MVASRFVLPSCPSIGAELAAPAPRATASASTVFVTRRQLLRASLATTAGVILGGRAGFAQTAPTSPTTGAPLAAGGRGLVATDWLNVRGGPGADEPLVGGLAGGITVDLLGPGADGSWWRVAAGDTVGYVDAQYLEPTGGAMDGSVFDLDLAIPYAPQLTAVWCDPADVEMWLGYHKARPAGSSRPLQSAIWDWETTHNAGYSVDQWDCSPYAVASAAHHWLPSLGFDHFRSDDPRSASQLLAWLLAHPAYREPSVALIWRGDHYVLVRGVRSVGDPSADPSGSSILGFYVADPNRDSSTWLGQDRFISYDRWLGELLTPVSYLTPHTGLPGDPWQGTFVTIQRSPAMDGPTSQGQVNATPMLYS